MPVLNKEKESQEKEILRLKKEVERLAEEVAQLKKEKKKAFPEQNEFEGHTSVFKLFADAAGQGFGMAHLDGTIIYMNPSLCRILDETNASYINSPFLGYYSPQHQKRLQEEILPAVMKDGQWTGELELISKKGRVTSTLENFFLLRDHEGNPTYFADVVTDISEQKAFSTALAEYSPNMIFINVKGKIVYANRICEEIIGYSREELYDPNFSFLQLTAPGYLDLVKEKFHQHMMGKEVEPYEYALITKEGEKLYTVLSTKLISYGGEPAILGIVTDITKRKMIEESLRENELNFRAILESSKESVFLIDISGKILVANPTMAERFGKKPQSVIGQNIYDLLPSSHREFRKKKLEEAIQEKNIVRFDDQREGLWLDSYIYPVIDEGEVTRLAILAIDITEKKRVEQSLRNNELLFRAILESIGTGILVVNDNGEVTHFNKRFAEMWQIPASIMESKIDDQLLGFVLDQLEMPEQFLQKVKELYQTDLVDHDVLEFKDGRFFERITQPLLYENKIGGRVWGFRDITEQKKMELDIQGINENLRELNAAKDKFFSIIAHDLRSPFSGLLGLSEVISDPTQELTIDEIRKYAGRLHMLLRNQFNLLQNLLEWSRLQRGGIDYKPERLNLRSFVGNVLDQLSINIIRKNVELENRVDSQIVILADADMLQSILLNLLSNAIKFTDSGGKINTRAARSEQWIEIVIEDTGVGISKERLAKIFELDKVNSTIGTAGEKGTGLGLILCKEFIEKHGGVIHAESGPGKGSKFIFTLPAE